MTTAKNGDYLFFGTTQTFEETPIYYTRGFNGNILSNPFALCVRPFSTES